MKIILKNLWNRRARYAWLFIELIVVTAIAWYVLDKAAVSIFYTNMPVGYDVDRLAIVAVRTLPENAKDYVADLDSAQRASDFDTFMDKLRRFDGVERISPQGAYNLLNNGSISINQFQAWEPTDSLAKHCLEVQFAGGMEYFETYGIHPTQGVLSAEELSAYNYNSGRSMVITEDLARLYWPDESAVGKSFKYVNHAGDTIYQQIVGVVNNVRYMSVFPTHSLAFGTWNTHLDKAEGEYDVLVRLRPGVDPREFAPRFAQWAAKNLKVGNLYVKTITPYIEQIREVEYDRGVTSERNTYIALAAFFLINLILGITGSFFLQTRRRIAEIGVHRSFGATRADVMRMLIGEGLVLATAAFVVGEFICLQILLKYGMDQGQSMNSYFNLVDNWVNNFWQHFALVSALVYACIVVCVLLGTLIPAWRASRVNPVDALRDE